MPDYKVYNPENEAGVGPTSYINTLAPEVQGWLYGRVGDELSQFYDTSNMVEWEKLTDEIQTVMDGQIRDVEALVPTAEILDRWALHASFDPEEVDVETAAWIAFDNAGRQEVYTAELMPDTDSPCGYSWELSVYEFDASYSPKHEKWSHNPAGTYWGYDNAYSLRGEVDALTPSNSPGIEWNVVEVNPDFVFEQLNVRGDAPSTNPPRLANHSELVKHIKAAADGIDIRKHVGPRTQEQFGPADDTVPDDPAESFSKEELNELRIAELEAESMALERIIEQRNVEIESLQEQLAAIEEASTPLSVETALEKVESLSLDDFTQRNVYEFTPDEWTHVSIEPADAGCNWTIERAGAWYFGKAPSIETAVATVQERLTEALSFRNEAKPKRSGLPGPDRAAKHANPAADQKAMTAAAKAQSAPALKPNAKVVS